MRSCDFLWESCFGSTIDSNKIPSELPFASKLPKRLTRQHYFFMLLDLTKDSINFLGSNWLVMVDAYSKYPCIHATTSTSSKATTDLLEQDFAHFGYPHTIVTDNSTSFLSKEFQTWCRERGIVHLTGAPYHPATNGAAERMVQTIQTGPQQVNTCT